MYIDYRDMEGLRRQSEEGAGWGFTGKQVIHPGQVKTVQRAFTPSQERREWAEHGNPGPHMSGVNGPEYRV